MSNAILKRCVALLKEASEMFEETGWVPGIDGEAVPAEKIVPEAKDPRRLEAGPGSNTTPPRVENFMIAPPLVPINRRVSRAPPLSAPYPGWRLRCPGRVARGPDLCRICGAQLSAIVLVMGGTWPLD
jgi:hypothetical protein